MLEELEKTFIKHRNAENAEGMYNYMRQQFDFYGIKMTPRRKLVKDFFSSTKPLDHDELLEMARELYEKDQREFHHTAIEMLLKHLKPKDLKKEDIEFFEWLICTHSWWDTVDVIAPRLVRDYFLTYPDQMNEIVDRWLSSENKWLVRSAILFQLKMKEDVDLPYLFEIILQATGTQEFFINKAIGWILREHGKRRPEEIKDFVERNEHLLHPLAIREGTRLLNKDQ